jgi:hypothetical protein
MNLTYVHMKWIMGGVWVGHVNKIWMIRAHEHTEDNGKDVASKGWLLISDRLRVGEVT